MNVSGRLHPSIDWPRGVHVEACDEPVVHQSLNLVIEEKTAAQYGHRGRCIEKRSLQYPAKKLLVDIGAGNVIVRSVAVDLQGMNIECCLVLERYCSKNQTIHSVDGDDGDNYLFANLLAHGSHGIACSVDLIRFEKLTWFVFVRSGQVELNGSLNRCVPCEDC